MISANDRETDGTCGILANLYQPVVKAGKNPSIKIKLNENMI